MELIQHSYEHNSQTATADQVSAQSSSPSSPSSSPSSVIRDAFAPLSHTISFVTIGSALWTLLTRSFIYRFLLCVAWIALSFTIGYYIHRVRPKRRASRMNNGARRSSRQFAAADDQLPSSPNSSSSSSPSPSFSALSPSNTSSSRASRLLSYAKSRIKKVTFRGVQGGDLHANSSSSDSASSSSSDNSAPNSSSPSPLVSPLPTLTAPTAQSAPNTTKQRVLLFLYLAVLLAVCGIATELYITLVAPKWKRNDAALTTTGSATDANAGTSIPLPLSSTPTAAAAPLFTWSSLYWYITRGLLVTVWLSLSIYAAYFAWYRKAIGLRKSKRGERGSSTSIDTIVEEDDELLSDEEDEDIEHEDETATRTHSIAADDDSKSVDSPSSSATVLGAGASASSPTSDAASVQSVPMMTTPTTDTIPSSPTASDASSSDEEEDEATSSTSAPLASARMSFPVPPAAALAQFEKLDASLFLHPEQPQNKWNNEVLTRVVLSKQARPAAPTAPSSSMQTPQRPIASTPLFSPSPQLHSTLYHLASTKFLSGLSVADFDAILPELRSVTLQPGELLFARGDPAVPANIITATHTKQNSSFGVMATASSTSLSSPTSSGSDGMDGMLIVVSGTVGAMSPVLDCRDPATDETELLCTFHQGDSIGELEFLFGSVSAAHPSSSHASPDPMINSFSRRPLTMKALTNVQLLRIPTKLGALWSEHPRLPIGTPMRSAMSVAPSSSASPEPIEHDNIINDASLTATTSQMDSMLTSSGIVALRRSPVTPSREISGVSAASIPSTPPRSDILLAFIKTTLARQWRSAEFILQEMLGLPLSEISVGVDAGAGATTTQYRTSIKKHRPSRYYSQRFSGFFQPLLINNHKHTTTPPSSSPTLPSMSSSLYSDGGQSNIFNMLLARTSTQLELSPGQLLFEQGAFRTGDQLFVVLAGNVKMTSNRSHGITKRNVTMRDNGADGGNDDNDDCSVRTLGPGSVLNPISYLTDSCHFHTVRALSSSSASGPTASFAAQLSIPTTAATSSSTPVKIGWLTREDLTRPSLEILHLCQLSCECLCRTLSQFAHFGFQRVWLRSGTLAFTEGEQCNELYAVASGRVRIVTGKVRRVKQSTNKDAETVGSAPHKQLHRAATVVSTPTAAVSSLSNATVDDTAAASSTSVSGINPSRRRHGFVHPSGVSLDLFLVDSERQSPLYHASGARAVPLPVSTRHTTTRVRIELGRGELVGEASFVGLFSHIESDAASAQRRVYHTATALCVKDTELIRITKACFENLLNEHPRIALRFAQVLASRLQRAVAGGGTTTSAGQASHGRTSVVSSIPRSPFPFLASPSSASTTSSLRGLQNRAHRGAGGPMSVCCFTSSPLVPLNDFALSLATSIASLGRHGSGTVAATVGLNTSSAAAAGGLHTGGMTGGGGASVNASSSASTSFGNRVIVLTSQHVDRQLGEGTCAQLDNFYHRSLLCYWIAHVLEASFDFLIYVTDDRVTPWTLMCQRQADLVLIVANAEPSATPAAAGGEADTDDSDVDDHDAAKVSDKKARDRHTAVSAFERLVVWNSDGSSTIAAQRLAQRQKLKRKLIDSTASSHHSHPPLPRHPQSLSARTRDDATGSRATPTTTTFTSSFSPTNSPCYPRFSFALRDLVLLHPRGTLLPRDTRRWFHQRPGLHRWHHVLTGEPECVDRLARYIAGVSVGVVLGGGGARGLAHMGVVRSFAEQSIPIDYIAGTSQGSFMAALYAMQPAHHTQALSTLMASRVTDLAQKMGNIKMLLSDATFPILSYFSGAKFGESISSILGNRTQIEDLWLPYFAVTTNIGKGDMCVHQTGNLWKAVRASMTVLDYLPPMQMSRRNADMLIDGGYTNNLPVDVLQDLYQPRFIIGVDVENKSIEEKLARVCYVGPSMSGWWLLKVRMLQWLRGGWIDAMMKKLSKHVWKNPRAQDSDAQEVVLPKFGELVASLLYINHNRNIRQCLSSNLIDLYIRPNLGATQLLDYHKQSEIESIGYAACRVKLTEWRIKNAHRLPKARADAPVTTAADAHANTNNITGVVASHANPNATATADAISQAADKTSASANANTPVSSMMRAASATTIYSMASANPQTLNASPSSVTLEDHHHAASAARPQRRLSGGDSDATTTSSTSSTSSRRDGGKHGDATPLLQPLPRPMYSSNHLTFTQDLSAASPPISKSSPSPSKKHSVSNNGSLSSSPLITPKHDFALTSSPLLSRMSPSTTPADLSLGVSPALAAAYFQQQQHQRSTSTTAAGVILTNASTPSPRTSQTTSPAPRGSILASLQSQSQSPAASVTLHTPDEHTVPASSDGDGSVPSLPSQLLTRSRRNSQDDGNLLPPAHVSSLQHSEVTVNGDALPPLQRSVSDSMAQTNA